MRPSSTLLMLAALLASGMCFAQSEHNPLVARISYRSTFVENLGDGRSPQICFAVYEDGYYRLTKIELDPVLFGPAPLSPVRTVQGRLSEAQLKHLVSMVGELNGKSSDGGLVLEGSESFTAEVVNEDKGMHYMWIDPDHLRPFPNSVVNLVRWLQAFKAPYAVPLTLHELSDQPVCPPASEKPLRPTLAELGGAADAAAVCGGNGGR
jgi:hypothetical protein